MTTQPARTGRLARLFGAADRRQVPLRTILVTVGVVAATYLAGKLIYLLRDIVLLMLVAGFAAMLLNPAVAKVQRRVPRRGLAAAARDFAASRCRRDAPASRRAPATRGRAGASTTGIANGTVSASKISGVCPGKPRPEREEGTGQAQGGAGQPVA